MRFAIGALLMAATLAACFFFAAVGAGLAGANPANFGPIFLMLWGFAGPIFFLGLYLASGGTKLSSRSHVVFLVLGFASIGIAVLAGRSL
ncbi:MAG: hypothetical protein V4753_13125 [Pseudomonadota bacterium]